MFRKESGILLHPTSLPGPYGVGELGPEARRWIDVLEAATQRLWQVLPLTPTGSGASPYQSRSSFAGNPLLVSLDDLVREGLLSDDEVASARTPPGRYVYDSVEKAKLPLLRLAARRLLERPEYATDFAQFCAQHASWLTDFTRFEVLKAMHDDTSWTTWPHPYRSREPAALQEFDRRHANELRTEAALQFLFETQWQRLKLNANSRGIRVMGDIPIFVALDSADVWAEQELFQLDSDGQPTVVAGVPPDYFSETGQRWGNPLYDWPKHIAQGFDWWTRRVQRTLEMTDLLRIDHFRGFAAYWEIKASEPTAVRGRWVKAPGRALLQHLKDTFSQSLPIVAEDLGIITRDVDELRDEFGLPTMRVLHFSFGGEEKFLPTHYPRHCVAYTGTHDNDTTVGWFRATPPTTDPQARKAWLSERKRMQTFFHTDGTDIHWTCIRGLLEGRAAAVLYPLQDVLGLGSEARMNTPGTSGPHNWSWRFTWDQVTPSAVETLRVITEHAGRNAS